MAHLDTSSPSARAHGANGAAASDNSVLQMIWRQKRMILWCAGTCVAISFVYLLCASKVYTATSRLLVQRIEPVMMTPQHNDSNYEAQNFLTTQCELLRATPILTAVVGHPDFDDMRTFDDVKNHMLYLKRNLEAEVGKKDDIITVSFSSKYPEEAVKIVDAAVDAYQKYCAGKKRETANEVLAILEKEKAKNLIELKAVDTKLLELKRAHHTISFQNDKGNFQMTRMNSLSDALTVAHMETINARSALVAAAKTVNMEPDAVPENLGGGIVLSAEDESLLRAQLVGLQQQLQERRRIYLQDHPVIKSLEGRINGLNMAYVGAAKVRYEQAKIREAEMQKSYEQEQLNAINLAAKAAEAQQLEAEAKRLATAADGLESRIKDVSIVVDSGALNITVLEFASYEDNPVKPSKAQVPGIALVLGLIIGCGVAVARELADPKLHSSDDIKSLVPAPVLGLIPRKTPAGTPSVLGQIVELDPHSEVSEAMRAVRTSLMFGVSPENARSILVTSPQPGDGKSTVAANLAIALANAGKRVLLIDGDLRNPTLQNIFGVSNDFGLSNILSNREEPANAILRCSVARLSLITGGPAPLSPSELLNDPSFGEMLSGLYKQYDHVVIDSPPVMRVDDARIMAATCDCTVLVTRAERTSHSDLRASVDRLADVGAFLAGVVLNATQGGSRYGRYGAMAETPVSETRKPAKSPERKGETATPATSPERFRA